MNQEKVVFEIFNFWGYSETLNGERKKDQNSKLDEKELNDPKKEWVNLCWIKAILDQIYNFKYVFSGVTVKKPQLST